MAVAPARPAEQTATRGLVVSIEGCGIQPTQVIGRTAAIVLFVVAQAERIDDAARGSVEFNLNEQNLKP